MKKIYTSDNAWSVIRNAFAEFLLLPTIIIIAFVALAYFSYNIDHAKIDFLQPSRIFLRKHVFTNSESTSGLLSAIVSGTISITSLTTTLLLVIVQQSAGSMTAQVFDQFLRRKSNQFYLGFFVGLALYSMITLSTVNEPFNPVWGGTLAFGLTGVALYLLVLLMYTTINQMRPAEIINAIYGRILFARQRQTTMLAYTTHQLPASAVRSGELRCQKGGFLNYIDVKALTHYAEKHAVDGHIEFQHSIGSYISLGEVIATLYNIQENEIEGLKKEIIHCVAINVIRNIDFDAAYGIEQLETITWTSTSTAKSNPAPGKLCVKKLHDVLSCWTEDDPSAKKASPICVVYTDNVLEVLMKTLENMAVVSSESMQHQIFIEIVTLFSDMLERMPRQLQLRIEKVILVMLSVMGDHVLTSALEASLQKLIVKLEAVQMNATAKAVDRALHKLGESVGKLNSRSTRV